MSISTHTMAVALGAVAGLLCFTALAGDRSGGMLMVTERPVIVARSSHLASSALRSAMDEAAFVPEPTEPMDLAAADNEAAPMPTVGSWTPLMALGLIPVAIGGAMARLRRRVTAAVSPIEVDLEAGSTAGAPLFQAPVFPTGRRMDLALGAKKGIHPKVFESPVYCGGDLVMTTNGTKKEYIVDIWSGNHPFYQNKGSVVVTDTSRLDKFRARYGKMDLGSLGNVPESTGPMTQIKMEPKPKKKAAKK